MSEQDLESDFERFRTAGDLRALTRVFDGAAPPMLGLARHLSGTREDAEDLLQATFLTAIEKAASWDRERPLLPWLLGILALHAHKLRRQRGRELEPARLDPPTQHAPDLEARTRELAKAVSSAVAELPQGYAAIVQRHLLEGAAPAELAAEFGLTPGNARVRLHRGLKLLRAALPAGFGGLGALVWRGWSGPRAVRRTVLEHAAKLTGLPLPAAGLSTAAVLVVLLAPVALALPAWMSLRGEDARATDKAFAEAVESDALSVLNAAGSPEPEPSAARAAFEPLTTAHAGTAIGALQDGLERVRGRLLRPNGAPAAGAQIALRGMLANTERGELHGVPEAWSDPAPISADAEGRFEWALDAPRAFQFVMTAQAPGCAAASWRWSELAPDTRLELGDVTLEPVADVFVRAVDSQGAALGPGWRVSGSAVPLERANGRDDTRTFGDYEPSAQGVALEGLPARRVEIGLSHVSGARIEAVAFELVAGQLNTLELVYTGPDLRRRISVMASPPIGIRTGPKLEHVKLIAAGAPPRTAQPVPGRTFSYAFDDLEPGSYGIVVDDPNFEPFQQANVQPGESVRTRLVGSAALRLALLEADGSSYTGPYRLSVVSAGGARTSGAPPWVSPSGPPPADGLVRGLVPGDYTFLLEIAGRETRELTVSALQPGETRAVQLSFAAASALTGQVLAGDGVTPLADVEVQLTAGTIPGHSGGSNRTVWTAGVFMPQLHASVRSDANGAFRFEGVSAGTWTVRAQWSDWLVADRTLEHPSGEPLELRQPPHGRLRGRVLVPPGTSLAQASLEVGIPAGPPLDKRMWLPPDPSTLGPDGSFDFGPLPLGEVVVSLMVATDLADGLGVEAKGQQLGRFAVVEGPGEALELDLRASFPARVRALVRIDGRSAEGGGMLSLTPLVGQRWPTGNSLNEQGAVVIGGLQPGAALELEYTSPSGWRWLQGSTLQLQPGEERTLELDLTTHERELQLLDAASGAPLPGVRIAWRTGSTYDDATDEPAELQRASAVTDAQGRLRLRLPAGPVRFVALPAGTLQPATLGWDAGAQRIELRRGGQ